MAVPSETTALDIATALVASYAAIVATLALGFQVFNWATTWKTRVNVRLRRMSLLTVGQPGEPVILFELTNHSGHQVKVTSVSLAPLRRGGHHLFIPHPLGLPLAGVFEIGPRDSATVWITPDVLAESDFNPNHRTRALIGTSDGGQFRSPRVRVGDLLADKPTQRQSGGTAKGQ